MHDQETGVVHGTFLSKGTRRRVCGADLTYLSGRCSEERSISARQHGRNGRRTRRAHPAFLPIRSTLEWEKCRKRGVMCWLYITNEPPSKRLRPDFLTAIE